jgi:hypothetical protein
MNRDHLIDSIDRNLKFPDAGGRYKFQGEANNVDIYDSRTTWAYAHATRQFDNFRSMGITKKFKATAKSDMADMFLFQGQ